MIPIQHQGKYRPDVDGLRAVAVLSVIAYHINKTWLPGGYVGVDIFFVISGFLITSIIWRELQEGRFSLADFYLRRIRRIIPVMLVVVFTTLLAGAFLLLPDALSRLSLSALFSVASAANVYFWRYLDDDYFAEASDQEPLLHLWSLGVEEQYYLIWPILLFILVAAAGKRSRHVALLTACIVAIASFALAEVTNESNQKFSHFMLPTRAGELMIGALLALATFGRRSLPWAGSPLATDLIAIAGLSAIGYSLFFLDDATPFPGVAALYPCVGAALIILAGGDSRILRWLLANRAMVWVGLISYSLYLWHWPILAFIRYFYGEVGSTHAMLAVLAMLVLSVLSYRYVEQPTRHFRAPAMRQVVLLLMLPVAAVAAPAAYILQEGGLKDRIESSPAYQEGLDVLAEETAAAYNFDYNCQLYRHVPGILSQPRCLVGATAGRQQDSRVLLWGDSHAAHHVGALDEIAKHGDFRIRNASHSSCPPVFGGDYGYGKYRAGCLAFRPYIRTHVQAKRFDVVILGAGWAKYDKEPGFRRDLIATISEIRASGARVVLLGQVPALATYNRECDMRWLRLGGSNCSQLKVPNETRPMNEFLASLGTPDGAIAYLDLGTAICDATSCPAYLDGKPIYFDKFHLSMRGSRRIGQRLIDTGNAREWVQTIVNEGLERPTASTPAMSFDEYSLPIPCRRSSDSRETTAGGAYKNVIVFRCGSHDVPSAANAIRTSMHNYGYGVSEEKADATSMAMVLRKPNTYKTAVRVVQDGNDGTRSIVRVQWYSKE